MMLLLLNLSCSNGYEQAQLDEEEQSAATPVSTASPSTDSRPGQEAYYVSIVPSKVQFHLCIKMVSSRLSFRPTSRVNDMMETLGLLALGSVSPQSVSSFVRIVCASNLQPIFDCS